MRPSLPFAAALSILVLSSASAQTDYGNRSATTMLTVGPSATFGASITVESPETQKVQPIFAFRSGAEASYPLTPTIGATLGLLYDSRGSKLHFYEDEEIYAITRVNYFSITPGFSFSAFWLGFNLGIPLGGTVTTKPGLGQGENSTDIDKTTYDEINFLVEPRIGANIDLTESELGVLRLHVSVGYSLSEIQPENAYSSLPADKRGDFHMGSGHLGVSYQFAIPGTSRK